MQKNYEFNDFRFFTEMSELASRHHSYDLSLGLPDFDIDPLLRQFLKESADAVNHSYEPLAGNDLLIENIIKFNLRRKNSIWLSKEEINIIPCSTFGLYTSLKSVLDSGDEVIVIQPSYYTYAPAIVLNGGIPVYYNLESNFSIDWKKLQQCISAKTKAIIVNSPQNPTGKTWGKKDWEMLYELVRNREIYLISEEVYDIYCYDDIEHYSSFLHPELKKRTFCIFSFGKMFHATGWKVSYLLAPENLLRNFRSHQQYISYGSNSPCQYAIAKYLEVFDPSETRKAMQKKHDIFNDMLRLTPFEAEHRSEGGFYQVANFRNINKTMTDAEFSRWLTIEKKVSCLPLSAFYNGKDDSDYVRFSFAKKDDVIINALEHLRKSL